jgi:septal ring factor EnvC (AmiA/AmiB activator)
MLAFLQPKVVEEAATSAVAVIVRESFLGAFAVLCLVLCVAAAWLLVRVQNQRTQDLKQMSDKMEKSQDQMAQLIGKMTEAFLGHKAALKRLTDTEKVQTETMQNMVSKMEGMRTTIDSVIRDAVRAPRPPRYTPSSRPPGGGT